MWGVLGYIDHWHAKVHAVAAFARFKTAVSNATQLFTTALAMSARLKLLLVWDNG